MPPSCRVLNICLVLSLTSVTSTGFGHTRPFLRRTITPVYTTRPSSFLRSVLLSILPLLSATINLVVQLFILIKLGDRLKKKHTYGQVKGKVGFRLSVRLNVYQESPSQSTDIRKVSVFYSVFSPTEGLQDPRGPTGVESGAVETTRCNCIFVTPNIKSGPLNGSDMYDTYHTFRGVGV